jgi:uncharacterized protein
MAAFRTFGISLLFTAAALAVGYAHGGAKDLFLLLVLAVLEVSLSFDNAIINAAILQRMSSFWRQMFLTVGIVVAVFGMRLVFPWSSFGPPPASTRFARWSWRCIRRRTARWNSRTAHPATRS